MIPIVAVPRHIIEAGLDFRRGGVRVHPPAHLVISITNPDKPAAHIPMEGVVGLLRRSFWDIELVISHRGQPNYVELRDAAFCKRDAVMIVNFVREFMKKAEMIVVHCEAGQSRSAGVAAALSKAINGDDSSLFNPPYTPNMRIYHTVLKHWMFAESHEKNIDMQ